MAEAIDEDAPQSDLVHERLHESPIKRGILPRDTGSRPTNEYTEASD